MVEFEISVLLAVRNGMPYLQEQLAALSAQTFTGQWELIVSDNGSSDASKACFQSFVKPNWLIVDSSGTPGRGPALNAAAALSRGKFLGFCDADDIVAPNWVEALVYALRKNAVVGGFLDEARLNSQYSIALRPHEMTGGLQVPLSYLPAPLGANCGLWKDLFAKVGGFDPDFVGAAEEVDMFWRVARLGYLAVYAPDAIVMYRHRSGTRALLRQYQHYGRGRTQLVAKYRDVFRPDDLGQVIETLVWVVAHTVDLLRGPERRVRYLRMLASLLGQIEASRTMAFLHVSLNDPKRARREGDQRF